MSTDVRSPAAEAPATVPPTLPRRGSVARRWAARLAALALSCAVAVVLLEGLVRVSGLDAPRVWVPDPELGWHHLPGSRTHWTEEGDGRVEINSLGYRDRLDRSAAKPPGAYRVAVFGDSMTEGVQVNLDQTFCHRLEDALSKPGRPVEVLNLGVNGYGPVQELLLFRREAERLKPDLVALAVFLDNDVADCDARLRYTAVGVPFGSVADGRLRIDSSRAEQSYTDYRREPAYTLRRFSATYRAVRDRWQKLSAARTAGVGGPTAGVPRRFQLYQTPLPPHWDEAWGTLEQVLVEFAAEARRQQTKLLVVSVPAGQVVSPAGWQWVLDTNPGMAGASFDLDGPERRLAEIARRHDLPLVQPYQAYRQAGQDPPLFIGHIGHFTPAGHELMTRQLAEYLTRNGLVPPPAAGP